MKDMTRRFESASNDETYILFDFNTDAFLGSFNHTSSLCEEVNKYVAEGRSTYYLEHDNEENEPLCWCWGSLSPNDLDKDLSKAGLTIPSKEYRDINLVGLIHVDYVENPSYLKKMAEEKHLEELQKIRNLVNEVGMNNILTHLIEVCGYKDDGNKRDVELQLEKDLNTALLNYQGRYNLASKKSVKKTKNK
jgi:hypothetical protein